MVNFWTFGLNYRETVAAMLLISDMRSDSREVAKCNMKGYTSRESRSMSMKSLRYILASPGYAPGTIAVNVTWKERGFNACQKHRSMYVPIYLQPFPSNLTRKSKSSPF